jgi:hypothetical protein
VRRFVDISVTVLFLLMVNEAVACSLPAVYVELVEAGLSRSCIIHSLCHLVFCYFWGPQLSCNGGVLNLVVSYLCSHIFCTSYYMFVAFLYSSCSVANMIFCHW